MMAWLKYLHMPGPTRLLPRLVFLNMLGLVVLSGGFLLLSESRQVLTNAYKQSLEAQARIIAGALGQAVNNEPFQFLEPRCLGAYCQTGAVPIGKCARPSALCAALAGSAMRDCACMGATGGC